MPISQRCTNNHVGRVPRNKAIDPAVSAISVSVNAAIALAAGSIALFLGTRPTWLLVQRWLMGTVLAGLAVRMALEAERA